MRRVPNSVFDTPKTAMSEPADKPFKRFSGPFDSGDALCNGENKIQWRIVVNPVVLNIDKR